VSRESFAVPLEFRIIKPLECDHFFTCSTFERCLTSHPGLTPYEHGATATLSRWSATIFGGDNCEFISKRGKEVFVFARHDDRLPVQFK